MTDTHYKRRRSQIFHADNSITQADIFYYVYPFAFFRLRGVSKRCFGATTAALFRGWIEFASGGPCRFGNRRSNRSRIAHPRFSAGRIPLRQGIFRDGPHVLRTLKGAGRRTIFLAQAALELRDGFIFMLLHPCDEFTLDDLMCPTPCRMSVEQSMVTSAPAMSIFKTSGARWMPLVAARLHLRRP